MRAVGAGGGFRGAVFANRATFDSAGEALEGDASAGIYPIRSERLLMERLEYDLLFRWFVGIRLDDPALGPFGVLEIVAKLSSDHFSVDGTPDPAVCLDEERLG
ncbi:hypothetical protein A4R29_05105 [Mesorhizobium ciceri biovar biserrulae]|nr:hypothetical protein A4R29_05105 [Mesorhizobium ciceri biovar biserrulae]